MSTNNTNKYEWRVSFYFLVAIFTFSFFIFNLVSAVSPLDITYPVSELSNCKYEIECRTFCDKSENIIACTSFAERHNLISREEANRARQFGFSVMTEGGPGGCRLQETCEVYCSNIEHIQECVVFAEQHSLMNKEEVKEAKKVLQALQKGIKPPGSCRSKQECEAYCEDSNHMEECLTFAEAAGLIPADELKDAKQVLSAIKKGARPPACRGKEECDVYCSQLSHFEECIAFAEAAGFISSEDAAMARKTGGVGPGGCRSKETCDEFCQDPTHQQECFNFAKEHDLIPRAELQQIEEGRQRIEEGLRQAPTEVLECLKTNVGTELLEKFRLGELIPGPQIGNQVKECFEKFMPRQPQGVPLEQLPSVITPERPPQMPMIPAKGRVCIQVITPALNPQTGECKEFPTPCDVPLGWQKVSNCQQQGGATTPTPASGQGTMAPSVTTLILPCLVQRLGQEVVNLFVKGQRMPSTEEIEVFKACFENMGIRPQE